jgi:hypothetical protein
MRSCESPSKGKAFRFRPLHIRLPLFSYLNLVSYACTDKEACSQWTNGTYVWNDGDVEVNPGAMRCVIHGLFHIIGEHRSQRASLNVLASRLPLSDPILRAVAENGRGDQCPGPAAGLSFTHWCVAVTVLSLRVEPQTLTILSSLGSVCKPQATPRCAWSHSL